jgi:hypothetical protein
MAIFGGVYETSPRCGRAAYCQRLPDGSVYQPEEQSPMRSFTTAGLDGAGFLRSGWAGSGQQAGL